MAWFKVDDGFATSPKVLSIPRGTRLAAIGLWTIAGTWCSKHLTDGDVPAYMLEEWGADLSHGTALVDAGLWVETSTGYAFHDWSDYQPAKVDVKAYRDKERQRKEDWRRKKAEKSGQSPANVPTGQDELSQRPSALPDPTRPDPTRPDQLNKRGAAKRGTRIADPFVVTAEMRSWAAERTPLVNVDRSTERFVNYWRSTTKNATKIDWRRTWNNWMLSDQERAEARPGVKPSKDERALAVVEMGQRLQRQLDGEQEALAQ